MTRIYILNRNSFKAFLKNWNQTALKPRTHRVECVAGRGWRVFSQKADAVWRVTRTVGASGRNRAVQASRIPALSRNRVGRFQIHFRVNHFAADEEWGRNTSSLSKHRKLTSQRGEPEGPAKRQDSRILLSLCSSWFPLLTAVVLEAPESNSFNDFIIFIFLEIFFLNKFEIIIYIKFYFHHFKYLHVIAHVCKYIVPY